MFKTAGFTRALAVSALLCATLFCAGGYALANEQEQHVPVDTHFYLGTGRPLPVEHLVALMPRFDLPETSDGAKSIDGLMAVLENSGQRLAEWGIDSELQLSVYTVGVMPVARIALKDPEKFETALDGLEKEKNFKSGKITKKNLTTRFYSTTALEKMGSEMQEALDEAVSSDAEAANQDDKKNDAANDPGRDTAGGLLVANDGKDLIVSFIVDYTDTALIDLITGVAKPEKSLAESGRLKEFRKQWGYGDEMVSFIDIEQVAATLTGSDSVASQQLSGLLENNSQAQQMLAMVRGEPCRGELNSLAAAWPMLVSGNRKFEVNEKEVVYDSHMAVVAKNELLIDTLMLLQGVIPESQSSSQAMMSLGLGITVDRLAQAVGQFSQLLSSMNYQCGLLTSLNDLAKSDLSAASMGVVMFGGLARGVQGISVNVFDVDINTEAGASPVESVDTAIAVSATDPALLIQTLKMMPQLGMLSELPLDGSELILNPMLPIPVPEAIQIKAAIKGKNIVIYSGENGTDYANRLGGNENDGLLQTRFNTRLIFEKASAIIEMAGQDPKEMQEVMAFLKSYPQGDINYVLDFTNNGIELNVGAAFELPAGE